MTGGDISYLLEVRDLGLHFEGLVAVRDLAFSVEPGELFAVVGPNGAGKTSTLNCISGLYRPQRGSIRLDGRELVGRPPHRIAALGLARTFQNVELFDRMSVVDNLMLGRHLHVGYGTLAALVRLGPARREEIRHRQAVEDTIELLELEAVRHRPTGLLPYGIRKRVELGRALTMAPRLLLLDEPSAGMSAEETQDMARFILDVRQELELTMILVSHHMGLVMDLADRILAVDFGQPLALGVPAEVQSHPDVIKAYLGEDHAHAVTNPEEAAL